MCLLEPVEEDITILATPIFSQKGLAKNEIAPGPASMYDVKHEFFRPEHVPAFILLRAVHPLNLNAGSIEQLSCFPFRFSQDRRLHTGTVVYQDCYPRVSILCGGHAAP